MDILKNGYSCPYVVRLSKRLTNGQVNYKANCHKKREQEKNKGIKEEARRTKGNYETFIKLFI